MQLKGSVGLLLAGIGLFSMNSSYAIKGILTDNQVLGIDCSGNSQCFGNISVSSKVFYLIVAKCNTSSSSGCTSFNYVNGLSNSNDSVLSAYVAGLNNTQGTNISYERYKLGTTCNIISGGAVDGTKQCNIIREKYEKNESGAYVWNEYPAGNTQTNIFWTPSPNICPDNNGVYLPGKGCTTSTTERVATAIPNNCDTCLQQAMNNMQYPTIENPISVNSSEKVENKIDLNFPIVFSRNYSSNRVNDNSDIGIGWRHNYTKRLTIATVPNSAGTGNYDGTLTFTEENGSEIFFTRLNENETFTPAFKDQKGYSLVITTLNNLNIYILTTPNGNIETYNSNGQIVNISSKNGYALSFTYTGNLINTITDSYGHSLTFSYINASISQVLADNGDKIVYGYNNGNLTTAAFNTNEVITYGYTNNKLTSITNANNKVMSMFAYDMQGRASETKRLSSTGNYIHQVTMDYSAGNNNYKATRANGNYINYTFTNANAQKVLRSSISTDPNTYKTNSYGFTYDDNGFPRTYVDGNNNTTTFNYNGTTGLLDSVKRPDYNETYYTYYPENRLIQQVQETTSNGTRNTYYSYDNAGNILQKSIETNEGSRSWNNTYTTFGKIETSTDPVGSVTTYAYYADNDATISKRGQLKSVTNQLGHVIQFATYDTRGNPTTIIDPNGVTKTLTYNNRGRIKTETVGAQVNSYNYDLEGNLLNSTFANGLVLTFTYDNSNRMTSMSDNNGNSQVYTLDSNNDQPTNVTTNSNAVLNNTKNYVFDKLGRLTQTYKANVNEYREYGYDSNNNLTYDRDTRNNTINSNYNNLNQLNNSSGRDGYPTYTYDLDGNLKTATLNNKTTTYSFNDFGEMTQLISPETGTQSIDYDLTNNRVVKTDAKGIVHTTEMDSLGRVKKITHDSLNNEYEEFNYDTAINGLGKIASVVNTNAIVSYEYDTLGRISKKIQVVNGISKELTYGYNTLGQLSSITYPSGLIVNYVYTRGLITSMTVSGSVTGTVLSSAVYQPFDNSFPKSYQFNGTRNRITQFDTNEKLISIAVDSVFNKTITQDGEYNYLSMIDNLDAAKSFNVSYDGNNKIDVFALNGINNKHYYDNSFNKTSNATMGFNYDIKNRLSSYSLSGNTVNLTYDDNGNTLTEGTTIYGYDLRNNLISVNKSGVTSTYGFNGLGQRTIKSVSGDNNYYIYDEAGSLAGEYDNAGSTVSEHIYLNGVPVGLVKANVLYNVHTDQIGTPRVITNSSNVIVWKWDNTDPYGANLPSINTIVYNKRFSGQYFDNESKLHYNYYRTYNPLVGRYIQSDPLGLAAGFNTYNYVEGNPFGASDPYGLNAVGTIYKQDIKITIPISIYGDTLNQPLGKNTRGETSAYYIKNTLNDVWNSQKWKYGDCSVSFNFDVSYSNQNKLNKMKVIENDKNFRSLVKTEKLPNGFLKGTQAYINILDKFAIGHEAAHLMGLNDKYKYNDKLESIPLKGWENNILGKRNGIVEQRNINDIINFNIPESDLKQCGCNQ